MMKYSSRIEFIKETKNTNRMGQAVSPSHQASNQAALIYPAPILQPQTQTGQEYSPSHLSLSRPSEIVAYMTMTSVGIIF
jgi:hypothetical protein